MFNSGIFSYGHAFGKGKLNTWMTNGAHSPGTICAQTSTAINLAETTSSSFFLKSRTIPTRTVF